MIKDKTKYNEYMADYMAKRYYRRREAALAALGGKCIKCGSTENLEFDHIDASTKSFDIGTAMASKAESVLQEELKKCQLLCRRHHTVKSIHDAGNKPWKHGTLSGRRYCSCELCKKAKSDYMKEYHKTYIRTR